MQFVIELLDNQSPYSPKYTVRRFTRSGLVLRLEMVNII